MRNKAVSLRAARWRQPSAPPAPVTSRIPVRSVPAAVRRCQPCGADLRVRRRLLRLERMCAAVMRKVFMTCGRRKRMNATSPCPSLAMRGTGDGLSPSLARRGSGGRSTRRPASCRRRTASRDETLRGSHSPRRAAGVRWMKGGRPSGGRHRRERPSGTEPADGLGAQVERARHPGQTAATSSAEFPGARPVPR